jgi:hypothetical protein
MKYIAALLALLVVFTACDEKKPEPAPTDSTQAQPQAQNTAPTVEEWIDHRFDAKSGIVKLKIQHPSRPGSDTMGVDNHQVTWFTRYFDDFGSRTAEYEYSDSARTDLIRTSIQNLGIGYVYLKDDTAAVMMNWSTDALLPNFNRLTDYMRTLFNVTEIEGREVAGKQCTGYSLQRNGAHSKIWTWKGIMLYAEAGAIPENKIKPMIAEATSVQIDIPVPPEQFQLPPGIKVVELGSRP